MKDVAYLFCRCLLGDRCEQYESELLDYYFAELKLYVDSLPDFAALEAEWRFRYPISVADFVRFLLGWMSTHTKVNSYSLGVMESVISPLR